MATLPGRCVNVMYCSLGAAGTVVRVPADGPFVCPYCGKVMVSPSTRRPMRQQLFAWFGAVVLIVMLAAFVGGVLLGGGWIWPLATGVAVMSTGALAGHHGSRAAPASPPPSPQSPSRPDGAHDSTDGSDSDPPRR
jgi:hypothetical protein